MKFLRFVQKESESNFKGFTTAPERQLRVQVWSGSTISREEKVENVLMKKERIKFTSSLV